MKLLRICVSALFVIVLAVFLIFQLQQLNSDKTFPAISIDESVIDVTIDVTSEELLQGVTAYDGKDGDLSDRVIVESISRFIEQGVSIVRYAVCDGDNHAAFASRTIRYTNYVPPRFTLTDSLVFNLSDKINIRDVLGAVDSIDGDISKKVIITANEYTANIPGVYYISAKVSNSKGDVTLHRLPVYVEDRSLSAPELELKEYITYLNVGDSFDIKNNVISAVAVDNTDLSDLIVTDTNLDSSTPGMYEIHYRVTDSLGRTGHKFVIVIVE